MKNQLILLLTLFVVFPLAAPSQTIEVPSEAYVFYAKDDFFFVEPGNCTCIPMRHNDLPPSVQYVDYSDPPGGTICGFCGPDPRYRPDSGTAFDYVDYTITDGCREDTARARILVESLLPHQVIFEDDFEGGPPAEWDGMWVPDCGSLEVMWVAALNGRWGLKVEFEESTTHAFLVDDSPQNEKDYSAAFLFDPNTVSRTGSNGVIIFSALKAGSGSEPFETALQIRLRQVSPVENPQYQLHLDAYSDDGTYSGAPEGWIDIEDEPQNVRIRLAAASAAVANGRAFLWINADREAEIGGLDNAATAIERVRLGAAGGENPKSGSYYLDHFRSWRPAPSR